MKIEVKRNSLLIIPECEQDRAFIEDSLGFRVNGDKAALVRVDDVNLGYAKNDSFVLKIQDSK